MKQLSVVIPVLNCEMYLDELIHRLLFTLDKGSYDYEIIFIDDGSSDNSWQIIKTAAAKNARIKAVQLSRNHGQHAALRLGILCTSKNVIAVMDADLQDAPEDLEKLYAEIENGYDVVHAVRGLGEGETVRSGLRKFIYILGRLVGINRYHQGLGNFKMFTRNIKDRLDFSLKKIFFLDNRLSRLVLRENFVPLPKSYRTKNLSRYTLWRYIRLIYRCTSELSLTIELILFLTITFSLLFGIYNGFSIKLKLIAGTSITMFAFHYIKKNSPEKYSIKQQLNFAQPAVYYLPE